MPLNISSHRRYVSLMIGAAVIFVIVIAFAAACGTSSPSVPTVAIGLNRIRVEVADTPDERTRGLSGRESLTPNEGMLFISDTGQAPALWMKGMRFPLDVLWIGADCTVVDTLVNATVPDPGAADSDLPVYRPINPAAYALEINADEVRLLRINVGDKVSFSGIEARGAGC